MKALLRLFFPNLLIFLKKKLTLVLLQTFRDLQILVGVTCGGSDGLADQTDAGAVTGHHCDVVVLATRQVGESTVGVRAVTFGVVAEAAPGVGGVRCGAARRVPRDRGDAGLAVRSRCEEGGNTRSWRRRGNFWYLQRFLYQTS